MIMGERGGDGCLCDAFGLDPDNPPRNGTFSVTIPNETSKARQ